MTITNKTADALSLIGTPTPEGSIYTPYGAAKKMGLALSTIYRAQKRAKEKEAAK